MRRAGQCLCGAVKISAEVDSDQINACHCRQCQRWSGGGAYLAVHVADAEIDGPIATYQASQWGERVFCPNCGSTITWRMQGKPISNLAVGLFDDQSGWTIGSEIFVDYRQAWWPKIDGASQSTEAEEFAKLDAYLKEQADDQ